MTRLTWLLACGLCASAVQAQCQNPTWSPEFGGAGNGLSSTGFAIFPFDRDGPGGAPEELYVGGAFQNAAGVAGTRGIAKWNGFTWSSVGGGVTSTSVIVAAFCSFDADGPGPGLPVLIAAGGFTGIGGQPASRIAAWNGTTWSPLGTGLSSDLSSVVGMAEFDADGSGPALPRLVVAGDSFTSPGGKELYAWNGTSWTELPDPGEEQMRALAVYDEDGAGPLNPTLFIGTRYNGGIKKLVGTAWQLVGGGLNQRSGQYLCDSLQVIDEDGPGPARERLWVGGAFTGAGPTFASGLAIWDGETWSPGPAGFNFYLGPGASSVHDIAAVDYSGGAGAPNVYVMIQRRLVRWNPVGNSWSVVGTTPEGLGIIRHVIAPFRSNEVMPSVYVTGHYTNFDQVPANYFARLRCQNCYANCDSSGGQPVLTANDFTCFVNSFAASDPYANCDGSTGTPALTANDFQCFLNQFAAGCS
jgi:hypothetical protein